MTTERLTPLTDLESDALAELANVAMARASVSLRTMIQHEVRLSVPTVEILAPKEAIARVAKPGNPNLVAVRQDFSGVFSGRALLIFPEASSLELVRVVVGRQLALEEKSQDVAAGGDPSRPESHLRKCQPAGIPHPVSSHQVRYQPAANPGLCRLDDGRSVGRRAPIADCRLRGQSRRPRRLNSGADGTKAAPLPSSPR